MKRSLWFPSVLVAAAALAMELPAPPAGFSWKEVPEIKAAFLMPNGWHFKQAVQGETLGLFITQENIDERGRFTTGLTINVFQKSRPGSAVEYAQTFIARMAADKHAEQTWSRDIGPLRSFLSGQGHEGRGDTSHAHADGCQSKDGDALPIHLRGTRDELDRRLGEGRDDHEASRRRWRGLNGGLGKRMRLPGKLGRTVGAQGLTEFGRGGPTRGDTKRPVWGVLHDTQSADLPREGHEVDSCFVRISRRPYSQARWTFSGAVRGS